MGTSSQSNIFCVKDFEAVLHHDLSLLPTLFLPLSCILQHYEYLENDHGNCVERSAADISLAPPPLFFCSLSELLTGIFSESYLLCSQVHVLGL
jgi:hypothetical protein